MSKQWTRADSQSTMRRRTLMCLGPNNAKADYANWGYRGRRNATMALSWLRQAVCVYATRPLGFLPFLFSFPQCDDLPQINSPLPPPKTPTLLCLFRVPHYRRCCQSERSRVRAEDQHDRYTPHGLINQLVFFPQPLMIQRSLWKQKGGERDEGCGRESGGKKVLVNKSTSLRRVSFLPSFFSPDIVKDIDEEFASSLCTCNACGPICVCATSET